MHELDAARKELEKEPAQKGKGIFGLFGKSNKDIAKKRDWETYKPEGDTSTSTTTVPKNGNSALNAPVSPRTGLYDDVLFDVDAIRAEIAQQAAEDRNSPQISSLSVPSTPANLRHVKSFDSAATGLKISTEGGQSTKASSHLHSPTKSGFGDAGAKDAYYYSDDDEDEFGNKRSRTGDGEIQMTFGRWDEPPPPAPKTYNYGYDYGAQSKHTEIPKRSSSYGFYSAPQNTYNMTTNTSTTTGTSQGSTTAGKAGVAGVTAGIGAMSVAAVPEIEPQKNVWANDDYYDDYDEDEFAEQEVTMSFA